MPSNTIETGDIILVTGITGYVGSHVADQLLAAGFKVRGAVRNKQRAQWLKDVFDEKYEPGKLSLVSVVDMHLAGALSHAIEGVSGVVHAATIMPMSDEPDPYIADVTALTVNALKTAASEPSVKRVVLTSSSMAAVNPAPDVPRTVTPSTWNNEVVEEAWSPSSNADRTMTIYGASKMSAEKRAWEWMEENSPAFALNSVLPNTNFGPAVDKRHAFSSTDAMLKSAYDGLADDMDSDPPQYFVDVRDTARIHVIALCAPEVQGERLFAFVEPYNWNVVLELLHNLYPTRPLPDKRPDVGTDISSYPTNRTAALLKEHCGLGWTTLKESIKDTLMNL